MAETITFSTTNKVPTRDGEISSQFTCEGPAEHVMIILDKFARGTVHESQGGERFRTELKEYPYERAARLIRELRAPGTGEPFDVEVPEGGSEDAEATALDDRVDDVLGELGEVVSQTSIRASLSRDSEDEPVVELVVEYKDRELVNVRSRLSELQDIDIPDATALEGTDIPHATALEGGPPDGEEAPEEESPAGEVVLDNGPRRRRGLVTGFRATANGENDRIDDEITQVLTNTDGGFVNISVDLNILLAANAKVALFIA